MSNKPGKYTGTIYTFESKDKMISFLLVNDYVLYPNHSVNTNTGHGIGIWTKVMSTFYFVEFTSGNLNREAIS